MIEILKAHVLVGTYKRKREKKTAEGCTMIQSIVIKISYFSNIPYLLTNVSFQKLEIMQVKFLKFKYHWLHF